MVPSEAASAGDETPVRGSSSTGRNRRENQQDEESVEKNYYFYATTSIDTRDRISQDDFLQKFGDSLKGLQEAADDNDSFVLKRSVPSSPAVDEDESDNDTFWTTQEMEGSIRNELKSSVSSHLDAKLDADAEQKVIEEAAKLFIKEPSSFSSATSDNESNLGDNKKFKMENGNGNHVGISLKPINNGALRRMSRHLSRELVKRRSSLMESMPETPAGWSVLISALASISLGHEIQLQKKLTCPPLVFGQCGPNADSDSPLQKIYEKLTERPESILSRNIQPSLFIGTRGAVASTASYLLGGPPSTEEHITFRQVLTMSTDGTKIAIDWELPPQAQIDSSPLSEEERKQQVMSRGGIQQPVVLVLHGMNNDSSFGYVRSLMRTFSNRGWVSVAMNFRGCGGVSLATPRPYNGSYTGDIRSLVQYLESRLASSDIPLFLVGNSLSANLLTKYLGEEGWSGTLPKCVAGAAALGNPLLLHATNLGSPWQEILAMGVKKDVLLNWPSLRHMTSPGYRSAIYNVLKARTIGGVDEGFAPILIRNEPVYPFAVRIGYENAEAYWADGSSCNYIKHISVPCLQIVAGDDMIVYKSFQKKLTHCIQNPNVMCVETKCGGHLGWQEAAPDSNMFGVGTSWADRATLDFFDAILKTRKKNSEPRISPDNSGFQGQVERNLERDTNDENMKLSHEFPRFRSKL